MTQRGVPYFRAKLGDNPFKRARFHTGLTQEDLGREVGVSRQSICSYETGEAYPSEPVLMRLCTRLGLNYYDYVDQVTVWHDHTTRPGRPTATR
jgi:DNA-binding XRE family transcriptional regulator